MAHSNRADRLPALVSLLAGAGLLLAAPQLPAEPYNYAVIIGIADFSDTKDGRNWKDLDPCVNDAVALAELLADQELYRGPEGEERIHLFTQAVPRADNDVPRDIPGVNHHRDYDGGRGEIIDVIEAVERATRARAEERGSGGRLQDRDFILVSISTHGSYVDTAEVNELRLLLPGYNPRESQTFLTFDDIAEELEKSTASILCVLNACHAEGALGIADREYYRKLFDDDNQYRAFITACKEKQSSWFVEGAEFTIFGKALLEALGGKAEFANTGDVTYQGTVHYLQTQVRARAEQLPVPKKQDPDGRQWDAGAEGYPVFVRCESGGPVIVPGETPPLVARLGKLRDLDRDDGYQVLHRYIELDGGEDLPDKELEHAKVIFGKDDWSPWEDYEVWEADRLGGVPAAGAAPLRKAWVEAMLGALPPLGGQTPMGPNSYWRKLAENAIPPAIRGVDVGVGGVGDSRPLTYDNPKYTGEFNRGMWSLHVSAGDPELLVQRADGQPLGVAAKSLKLQVKVPTERSERGGMQSEYDVPPTQRDPILIPLAEPNTMLTLRVRERGREELVSSPRTLEVSCPANLTIDSPPPDSAVTQPTVTLSGRIWHDGKPKAKPQVLVEDKQATFEAGDNPTSFTWTAEGIELKEGWNDLNVSAKAGRQDIGEIATFRVNYEPIDIQPRMLAGLTCCAALGQGEQIEPGRPTRIRLKDEARNIAVLEGEFPTDERLVEVSLAGMSPVLRPVTVSVAGDGFDPSLLTFRPADVPLVKLDGYDDDDAMVPDGDAWRLAGGTYSVVAEEADIWQLDTAEFTVDTNVNDPIEVPIAATRHAIEVTVSLEGAERGTQASLRKAWLSDATPVPIGDDAVRNLEAGDYFVDIQYAPEAEREVDVDKVALEGAEVVEASDEKTTLKVRFAKAPRALKLPFRDRFPPCSLPFMAEVASIVKIDGRASGRILPGSPVVPLPRDTTAGKVAIETEDGLVYFRGKLEGTPRERKITGSPVVGELVLANIPTELADILLSPVEGKVPFFEGAVAGPKGSGRKVTWGQRPVGAYELTAVLGIQGIEPITLRRPVTIADGKQQELAAGDLLDTLTEEDVRAAVAARSHPLKVKVSQVTAVRKTPKESEPANGAMVRLSLPQNGQADGVAAALARLAKLDWSGAEGLIRDATSFESAVEGGVAQFEGVWEGTYDIEVKLPGRPDWLRAHDVKSISVPKNDGTELEMRSWWEELDLPIPEEPGVWKLAVNGEPRELAGARVPLLDEGEKGPVELRTDIGGADVVFWAAKLQDGELRPRDEEGFIRGSFGLSETLDGMAAALIPDPQGIPYLKVDPNYAPGRASGGDGTLKWDELPLGRYELHVEGFEPLGVTVLGSEAVEAKALAPLAPALQVERVGIPEGDELSCEIEALELKVPAIQLAPERYAELTKGLKLEDHDWTLGVPWGTYRIRAVWQHDDAYEGYEDPAFVVQGDDARLVLDAGDFQPLEVKVEVFATRIEETTYTDPNRPTPVRVDRPVELGQDAELEFRGIEPVRGPVTATFERKGKFVVTLIPGKYELTVTMPGEPAVTGACEIPMPEDPEAKYVLDCTVSKDGKSVDITPK